MSIGLVIPVYNKLDLTKSCLESLNKTQTSNPEYSVIVVDDGSTDGTEEYFSDERGVTYLKNTSNVGYTETTNRGVKYCLDNLNCEFIVLLNNDVVFNDRWLAQLTKYTDKFDIIGFFSHYGNPVTEFTETDYLEYSCVLVKREVFEKVGLLDEKFNRGYYSDNDFCLRALLEGFKIGVIPQEKPELVTHLCGQTLGAPVRNEYIVNMFAIFDEKWGSNKNPMVKRYIKTSVYNPNKKDNIFTTLLRKITG